MPVTTDAAARTRVFARVLGPLLVIIPAVVAARAADMEALQAAFFDNPALVWITGAMLLSGGLLIIANHQVWSGPAPIMVSVLGWFFALRGVLLLAVPQLIAEAAEKMIGGAAIVRMGFAAELLVGLWLTYAGWIARSPPS